MITRNSSGPCEQRCCSYVGSSLTVRNPIGQEVQNNRDAIERCAQSGSKKQTKTYNKGV